MKEKSGIYQQIYEVVRLIPEGKVTTYGTIGRIVGCSARQVGYAMASSPPKQGIPGKGSSTVRDASVFEVMVLLTQDKESCWKKKALTSITKGVLTSIGSYGRKLNKTLFKIREFHANQSSYS